MNNEIVLRNFINLPNPPKEELEKRDQKIKQIIEQMGHKYRLSRPMPKVGC